MAIRYKNPQTGEYEVIKIPVMKGEQGHAGIHVGTDAPPTTDVKLWFDPSDTDNDVDLANRLDTTLTACYDYMGNDRGSIKAAADANVDWLLGEINTAHYEGQNITATDSIEGRSKSAILKGQTLVNLNKITYPVTAWSANTNNNNYYRDDYTLKSGMIRPSTKYLFKVYGLPNVHEVRLQGTTSTFVDTQGQYRFNGKGSLIVTSTGNIQDYSQFIPHFKRDTVNNLTTEEMNNFKMIILEYQEGMENWDIPYFEGMQSVQMPVLTTTGKNLFNKATITEGKEFYNGEIRESERFFISDFIKAQPNTAYTMSGKTEGNRVHILDKDKNLIYHPRAENNVIITPNDDKVCYVRINGLIEEKDTWQLEKGAIATSYEPYKSNILTVNEDVELRGIGDVKDTLDLTTGEVTKRIEEIVLDGGDDEEWITTSGGSATHKRFVLKRGNRIKPISNVNRNLFLCDKFNTVNSIKGENSKEMCLMEESDEWYLSIVIDNTKLNSLTVDGFKSWLQSNNVKMQYVVESESIKTVGLSDNHVYSYKDVTHYDCSSEEGSLVPTLSIDVPTNLSALVTKQRQQIRTLEEENKELNQELQLAITSSEESDNELLAQSFELDFRLMEVECALDLPMAATFRLGGKAMAMTPYEMAKKLILADNYDRADMEHKLDVYVSKKRMTEAERQELIQLMDEKEGVITIDPVEPEVEESIIEHEAVTIPLH